MCKVNLFEIKRILIHHKTTSRPPLHHFLQNLLIHVIGQKSPDSCDWSSSSSSTESPASSYSS